MTFTFQQSESVEASSSWLKDPGKYHFCITAMDGNPIDKQDKPIDGLKIELEVLAGGDGKQVGKTFETILWKGKDSDKDKGEMANKKLTRLLVALGAEHKPGKETSFDPNAYNGYQLIAELAMRAGKDGKERLDVSYANIYHVDDPAVESVPKNAEALAMIPAALRKAKPKDVVNNVVAPTVPTSSGAGAAAPVSLDEI